MKEIIEEYGEYLTAFMIGIALLTGYGIVVNSLKIAIKLFVETLC
ncbi:MAG: hypothetical protein UHS41_02440 [Lachnospiraceae bacterium]|nr:hypothetical protein [Lachnospiraceae bacterium]